MDLPLWLTSSLDHFKQLSPFQLTLVLSNIFLLLIARPLFRVLLRRGQVGEELSAESGAFVLFRRANLISLLGIGLYAFVLPLNQYYWATKVISALLIISVANLVSSVLSVFILRRYGKKKVVEGEERYVETYRSRLVNLVSLTMIGVIAILLIVQLIGFQSLLETGGVIGFIGVMLALTQGAWAPDLISGLIILNTGLLEEGDVIELSGTKEVTGTVFKTKLFHTEVLDLRSNHRVMVPNSSLRQQPLMNLSKFASAKGLRECLTFNIGYDVAQRDVMTLFNDVFEEIKTSTDIPVNDIQQFEISILDTGDYAIKWGFFYYLKEVKTIFMTRRKVFGLVAKKAKDAGISLATPILLEQSVAGQPISPSQVMNEG